MVETEFDFIVCKAPKKALGVSFSVDGVTKLFILNSMLNNLVQGSYHHLQRALLSIWLID